MSQKPLGSSTPNYHPRVTRRRGLHSYDDEEIFSPVTAQHNRSVSPQTRSPIAQRHNFHTSSDLDDTEDSEEEFIRRAVVYQNSSSSRNSSRNDKGSYDLERDDEADADRYKISVNKLHKSEKDDNFLAITTSKIMIFCGLILFVIIALVLSSSENISLDDIKKEFPLQDQDFWLAVESGLNEVVRFEKPSIFLLMYKENGESTTDRLLTNISTYASCVLNKNCELKPIILSSDDLIDNDVLKEDGGYLLTTYKSELENVHVMIVKNLEKLPGHVATVLHSFCDEISPAVEKSVFFLTIKVPEFPKMELSYIKNVLRGKWHDIKEDHFEPLFARISGMILSVKS